MGVKQTIGLSERIYMMATCSIPVRYLVQILSILKLNICVPVRSEGNYVIYSRQTANSLGLLDKF